MNAALKCTKALCFVLLSFCDLSGSLGLMMYVFYALFNQVISSLLMELALILLAVSIVCAMFLTRIPAAYQLFFEKNKINHGKQPKLDFIYFLSLLFLIILLPSLFVVQYLGNHQVFYKFIASSTLLVSISVFLALGSAVGYLAFVYKQGVLKNLFFRETSFCLKSIIVTVVVSILGALGNVFFAYFALYHALAIFPFTQNLSEAIFLIFSTLYAFAIFFMLTFSYIYELYEWLRDGSGFLHGVRLRPYGFQESVFSFMFLGFLINVIFRFLIFSMSGYVLLRSYMVPVDASVLVALLSGLSASAIILVFELRYAFTFLMKGSFLQSKVRSK